ncbi:hypothetical protein [Streptomyces qinglanensis]|uniref:hypothetical protein n=1 Tax=Streptomyces qinglanensis TaxID=943816 RepID=UPI003D76180A
MRDYSRLLTLPAPSDTLYDAVTHLSEAAATLGRAYEPTKKNPASPWPAAPVT